MVLMAYNENGEQVDLTPAAYRDVEWAKNVKSPEDLFTQFDNAQKLIGKSVQVPAEDAPPEDWGKVYNKLGRPEKPEDYGLKLEETADAALKEQASALSKIFHDNGLSKKQAAKLLEGVQTISKSQLDKMTEAQKAKDTAFTDLMKKTFGDKEGEAKTVTRNLLEQFAPAELKGKLAELPAEQLTLLAAVLKGVSDKYISQDDLRSLGAGTASGGKTADDYRKEGQTLMQSEEYKNVLHVNHKRTVEAVNEAYKKFTELSKK